MGKFATGRYAIAICDRCGQQARYLDLVPDGYTKGLRVHPWCRDTEHPQEKPFRGEEGIALRHPRPSLDDDSTVIASGTAQAGAPSSITLAASTTNLRSLIQGNSVEITAGTGIGQSRTITDYNPLTKIAAVDSAWTTQPDATSEYEVVPGLLADALGFTTTFGGGT